ncbi:O-antigen ligase family protein [Flavobacterium sp. GT3P67]|uniref:O-antigen ligase family protein n=1 Tax=Flavobacterium sp. GT3P67 TaxID=2541722 RepID=UPI001044B9CF|nr:O-antigen ligase family protein [Flavobacterium sp. GT3P67]TDE51303.1 hypothetical protein E0H99_11905 [Flavobacterium sp. GT3P67]
MSKKYMSHRNIINNSSYKLYEYFYIIVVIVIIFQLYIPQIRLGVITAIIIFILIYKNIKKHSLLYNSSINKLVLFYILYNSISILWFLLKGFPVSVFFAEWTNSILPVFFFYFSYPFKKQQDNFYRLTLLALIFSFIIGFVLWIMEPPFYRAFMDVTEGPGTDLLFFQSIFGLTATGALGFVAFLISFHIIFKSKGKNGKIALLVSLVATILTFRRSALVVLIMSILVMHFIGYFRYSFVKKRYFLLELAFFYGVILFVSYNYDDFFTNLFERVSMLSEAFDERKANNLSAFSHDNFLIGGGLGAYGHKVVPYSKVVIADGNYFKMFAELGIIGTFIFFSILACSIFKGMQDLRNKYLEMGIVIGLSLMAVGSNIFEYQIIAPVFWYSVGKISAINNPKIE